MNEEVRRILQMLQDGTLTPEQADRLLSAIEDVQTPNVADTDSAMAGTGEMAGLVNELSDDSVPVSSDMPNMAGGGIASPRPPDFDHIRSYWRYPFIIALGVLLLGAIWLSLILNATGGAFTFGAIIMLGIVILGALAMGLAWWSQTARWVHVRVEDADGDRVRISIPFSTRLISWGIKLGRGFVDTDTRQYMDMAEAMFEAIEQDPNQAPISIDVDDGGDRVQVYVG